MSLLDRLEVFNISATHFLKTSLSLSYSIFKNGCLRGSVAEPEPVGAGTFLIGAGAGVKM